MRRAVFAFWIAALLFTLPSLPALDIDGAVALAVESSPEVVEAMEAVREAAEAIGSPFELEKSRLSVTGSFQAAAESGGVNTSGPDSATDGSYSARADVSLPILPQLSVSGGVDAAGEGSASVSVVPFAPWKSYTVEKGAYRQSLAALEGIVSETRARAEKLVLDYLVARFEVEHAKEFAALQEQAYEAVRRSYDLGEADFEEVRDAQQHVGDARRQYLAAERTLISAGKTLSLLLGPAAARRHTAEGGAIQVEPVSIEEIMRRIEERDAVVQALAPTRASSAALERARIELETLERQERETWFWRPTVTVQGGVSYPDFRTTASVSLSFSPSDLNGDRIQDLDSAIDDTIATIDTEEFTLALDVEAARRSVDISREAFGAALLDRERARLLADETEVLLDHGERTVIEARQANLSLRSAEIGVFRAGSELLAAQNDYLLYFESSR